MKELKALIKLEKQLVNVYMGKEDTKAFAQDRIKRLLEIQKLLSKD